MHSTESNMGFPEGSVVKNPLAMQEMQEMWVPSLGRQDFLEEEMATHSSILPEKSHGQKSLAGYSRWGRKDSNMTKQLSYAKENVVQSLSCIWLFANLIFLFTKRNIQF